MSVSGLRRLVVDNGKGNVLDSATCSRLCQRLEELATDPEAKLLVVEGAGEHFSFGASVEEHLPDKAQAMLTALHGLVRDLVTFPVPTLAAVRGRCLGGGLEVALACDFLFVEQDAVLATPEIRLGVFAPSATALLQAAIPRAEAAEILLTGRDVDADEAYDWGLANEVTPPGELDAAVEGFAEEHFEPRSAASLRVATRAWRTLAHQRLPERLDTVERLYLDDLLSLHDGSEGIRAFLEKRQPQWRNG